MNRVNVLRQKIADGKLVKGFFLTMSDPMVSEIAGFAGYDYVWIDAEHAPLDRQEIFYHIMAAQGSGCCAFVRVANIEPAAMKAILDMGPDGIIFPFVNSAEEAKLAVSACSYPDDEYNGLRGQGPIRAIRYGLDNENDYMKAAYGDVLKIMQIETMEGYESLEEIMNIKGIDSLFIGAADLSRSINGRNDGTKLDDVYDDMCKRIREKGIILGAAIGPCVEDAQRVTDKGVQWVVFGQDSRTLAMGLKANLDALKDF
ncbi:MAG: HpcH/HpaI aldolase [Herbinix sp.]|jgi:2-dehydro-3-deoxyglucarate aldolase/4-hydroxy-2-oxoheptanedioate aldolase|nr:HpcH/HpaI aldolase [Herbinix sp.]